MQPILIIACVAAAAICLLAIVTLITFRPSDGRGMRFGAIVWLVLCCVALGYALGGGT